MSEMEWEEAPGVSVPRVRPWFRRELAAWTRGCYPPRRRGVTVVWGWLVPIWAVGLFLKFWIYGAGVVVLMVAYPFWVVAELITYRRRVKRTALRAWNSYLGELHGES